MTQNGPQPSKGHGLRGRRILIVEDEFLIAEDLARYFAELGAEIVGPTGSLAEAFHLSATAEAALLDINLGGEMVFPLAEALIARNIPFVFFTAYPAISVPRHLRGVERFLKPASYARVERNLRRRLEAPEAGEEDELVRLLPKLRIAARLILRDAAAADRLVERTLEQAVLALPERDASVPLETWIVSILRVTADRDTRRSMI